MREAYYAGFNDINVDFYVDENPANFENWYAEWWSEEFNDELDRRAKNGIY